MSLVNLEVSRANEYQYSCREGDSSVINAISSVVSSVFRAIANFFCYLTSSIGSFFCSGSFERDPEDYYIPHVPSAPPLPERQSYYHADGTVELLPVAQRVLQEPIYIHDARLY